MDHPIRVKYFKKYHRCHRDMDSISTSNDLVTLILGTSAMLVMSMAIISFAFVFQRKLLKKQKEYSDIETLLKQQELKSAYQLIEGQDEERKRIAADVHDNIGSLLATLKIYSDLASNKTKDPEVAKLNEKVSDLIDKVITEIRKISHSLDSGTLLQFGLEAAVGQLCEAIRNSGKVKIDSIIDITQGVSQDFSLQTYRIIQELFTNTLKHAGASTVRLELTQTDGMLTLIYEDDGVGFDVHQVYQNSLGLKTIQSRAQKMSAEVKIESGNSGSTFIFEIPHL